jgi:hypothetical protein
MKNTIAALIILSTAALSSFPGYATEPPIVVSATLQRSLPEGWRIAATKESALPYWSFSNERCNEITIVGPNRTGFRYLDGSDKLVLEHFSQREAIVVWITSKEFDPKWSIGKRIKNRIDKTPIEFPDLLHDGRVKIYGLESLFSEDNTYADKSPQGTEKAVHLGVSRSWPSWRVDITRTFAAGTTP